MTEDNSATELQIKRMLEAITGNPSLKQQLRMAVTAEAVCNVAREAGVEINPAALVKFYAQSLVDAPDAIVVENFNVCSWDAGELLWAMTHWKQCE